MLNTIKELADTTTSATSTTTSSAKVARKSDDYPYLDELSAKAEPNIYKEIKNKAKKSTTSRPKIDPNDPCASCPARDTKSDRFVDGEGS